ncbi:MAG: hypothetical protein PF482_22090 [Desulfobacteraceae bacterium]|jgi:hypothetical protein|nr:hypothetical protein [Desulfobacteraceae bacterium]
MAQRLIQISFSVVPPDDIARMIKDIQIVNMWQDPLHPERNILQGVRLRTQVHAEIPLAVSA